jgi:hypothetical protein
MAVENRPKLAERVAREHGGEPFTGDRPADRWGYRLVAAGVAARGKPVELGRFAFPFNPGWASSDAVAAAITLEDGMTELTTYRLGKPTA